MSILSAAVGGIWKVAAIVALAVAAGASGGWTMTAHDLRDARADLVKVRAENGELKSAVHDQNIAVAGLAAATSDALARRASAEKAAAATIASATTRASAVRSSAAPDCAGVLNEAWEAWK